MNENVYDRLKQKLEVQKREEGISPLDLAELPANLRKIMRLMLREIEMTYPALCAAVENLPPADRLNHIELDATLELLTTQNWLIRRGEGERVNYLVNLRRKPGSQLSQDIWTALNERITQKKEDNSSP